jgi:hypothetical protein
VRGVRGVYVRGRGRGGGGESLFTLTFIFTSKSPYLVAALRKRTHLSRREGCVKDRHIALYCDYPLFVLYPKRQIKFKGKVGWVQLPGRPA